jgi:NAD(P)-dependent dehydrogenase (short-subunit alcohol dehydrogenase family)
MSSVLITGTSSGIGLETSLLLARAGHTVYATMRHPERAPQLEATAEAEKLPIRVLAMDVDSDESVQKAFGAIQQPIDVLINNAGIERRGSIEELPMQEFRACMETNYFGAIRCIQAVLPSMRERHSGLIVNMSSIAGAIACAPLTPYSASKFALEAMTEALAQEVKPLGIRVVLLQPGFIDTAMPHRLTVESHSIYPHSQRFAGLFGAALKQAPGPTLVAEAILRIINEKDERLRYRVGPSAEPFLAYRAALTDEQWIAWGAVDDDTWYARVQNDFGLNARPSPGS